VAIRSFADRRVEDFFVGGRVPRGAGWTGVSGIVARKLDMIDYAHELRDLGSPPGNRLEHLKGKWNGYQSIRINDQWRIVFRWTDRGPEDVDVVDYH